MKISLILLSFILLFLNSSAQVYSDSVEQTFKNIVSYQDEEGVFGFKKNGKEFIEPIFKMVFPFTSKITTVVDSTGKYGILNHRGRWYLKPEYELISPIVNSRYIILSGDEFKIYQKRKLLKTVSNPFDTDYMVFRDMVEKSDMLDKALVLRVMEMTFDSRHHHDLTDTKKMYSKTILSTSWGTKWILDQLL
ncbi:MAG: hypothetical protein GQ574_11720 [Crocinitomix sp.]|nr:hypothetical protein [Crocinitomix sp.]